VAIKKSAGSNGTKKKAPKTKAANGNGNGKKAKPENGLEHDDCPLDDEQKEEAKAYLDKIEKLFKNMSHALELRAYGANGACPNGVKLKVMSKDPAKRAEGVGELYGEVAKTSFSIETVMDMVREIEEELSKLSQIVK
jgi:hypothetical protein